MGTTFSCVNSAQESRNRARTMLDVRGGLPNSFWVRGFVFRCLVLARYSRINIPCASRSRSMYGSPLTSTATRLIVPPVKANGRSPG